MFSRGVAEGLRLTSNWLARQPEAATILRFDCGTVAFSTCRWKKMQFRFEPRLDFKTDRVPNQLYTNKLWKYVFSIVVWHRDCFSSYGIENQHL
jgi:hypothetical protein